jgi:hypothetical protein
LERHNHRGVDGARGEGCWGGRQKWRKDFQSCLLMIFHVMPALWELTSFESTRFC